MINPHYAEATVQRSPVTNYAGRAPCVLVITDDYHSMVELRVRIPFDAMYKSGLIRGYHVFHRGRLRRSVGIPAEIGTIDVVWVQRVLDRNLLFVVDALSGHFVYDIDDNLLIKPLYQASFSHSTTEVVSVLLREAKVVSSTSVRLLSSLQKRSGIRLDVKSVIAPNLAEEVHDTSARAEPTALLLAMSGNLPLTASRDGFITGVKRFLEGSKLPVHYIGSHVNELSAFGPNVRATGLLNYFTYRQVIRMQNAMAIAPLEGRGDPATQEFVDSKSDIKMVEFGSCNVPALYADVAPYRDTPLRCGPLVDMGDADAVTDALHRVFLTSSEIRAAAEESVREHRLATNCVAATWFGAVEAGRLPVSLVLEDVLRHEAGYAELSLSQDDQLSIVGRRIKTHSVSAGLAEAPEADAPARPVSASRPRLGVGLASAKNRMRRIIVSRSKQTVPLLFDSKFYLLTYSDVRTSGVDPYLHYRENGINERRNPNPFFDTEWYIRRNPDAGLPGVDPLQHYLATSAERDVDPGPRFSSRLYRTLTPGLGTINPLEHYLLRTRQLAGVG